MSQDNQFAPGTGEPYPTESPSVDSERHDGVAGDSHTGVNYPAESEVSTKHDGYATANLDALFDWLNELDDDKTVALFELLGAIDPLATESPYGKAEFKYSETQRDLLGEAARTFKSAGFGE